MRHPQAVGVIRPYLREWIRSAASYFPPNNLRNELKSFPGILAAF